MADGNSALMLWHTFDQKTLAHAGVNSTAAALKPDFSVTGKGVSVTDLTTVVAVEVKKKKFDDAARAQVPGTAPVHERISIRSVVLCSVTCDSVQTLGYGFAQMRAQKMRTLVYVALTNLRDIQLWRLRRAFGGAPIEVDEYAVEVLGSAEGFGTLAFLLNSDVSALVCSHCCSVALLRCALLHCDRSYPPLCVVVFSSCPFTPSSASGLHVGGGAIQRVRVPAHERAGQWQQCDGVCRIGAERQNQRRDRYRSSSGGASKRDAGSAARRRVGGTETRQSGGGSIQQSAAAAAAGRKSSAPSAANRCVEWGCEGVARRGFGRTAVRDRTRSV
jgi:hypothetical protein